MGPGTYQIWKFVQYIICIRTKIGQIINAVHSSRGIYLSVYSIYIYNYNALFVCVKSRLCLKTELPAYCFNIFGSIFGVLLFILIKKLILGWKTIWKSMRKFPRAIWCVRTFPHMNKQESFWSKLKTAHWYDLIFFR